MPTERRERPIVLSVHASDTHSFGKRAGPVIRLLENWGVAGDAHAGPTDQHRYHMRRFGPTPNLRQVHLIQSETLDELLVEGHVVRPGDLGENISTRNLDLLALPTGTRLHLGPDAVIELTGLRNPCVQIDNFQRGLMKRLVARGPDGPVLKCGVMSVVIRSGEVRPGDAITIALPPPPHRKLIYVPPVPVISNPADQFPVIPGRTVGANPESSGGIGDRGWIPGPLRSLSSGRPKAGPDGSVPE